MNFEKVIDFLKNDIWGLIILGGIGSVFGTLLIFSFRKFYIFLARHFDNIKYQYFFREIISNYSEGFLLGYSSDSTFRQIFLVGRFIINMILFSTILLIQLIIAFGILVFIQPKYYWVVMFVLGLLIMFPIYKLSRAIKFFKKGYCHFFDKKLVQEKAQKYFDGKVIDEKEKISQKKSK